ncbi:penicillin-binding protein activator [Marinobacter sp. LN3S78]|uniref:penicillin-binding protein activator n=1 Tax=Marinobacter sp. LN3S78 TaxID=3382300 RepID=UPI00387B0CDB
MRCHLPNLRRLAVASTLTALLASGCTPIQLQDSSLQSAGDALSAAQELSAGLESQRFLLRSAATFQERGEHEYAREVLLSTAFDEPEPEVADQYLLLSMDSAVALEDREWAADLVAAMPETQYQQYPEDLQARAAQLQDDAYSLAQAPLPSARFLMNIQPELLGIDRQQLNDRIWQTLKETPDAALNDTATSAIGFENQGWYELAATLRQPGMSLEAQGHAVRNWRFNWSGHPGAETVPTELALLTQVLEQRPERITLALPLSGPLSAAGNMVREGFLAAYYAAEQESAQAAVTTNDSAGNGAQVTATRNNESSSDQDTALEGDEGNRRAQPPEPATPSNTSITIVDTNGRPFEEVLPELLASDPDLIVGPLAKDEVAALASRSDLPVPVLALNYAPEQDGPTPAQLFQFGLSVEDEARQIAERIVEDGVGQALVLIPEGDWGDRIASALEERMQELGGIILDMERYSEEDNFRDVSAELLGINISRERAIELERTMGLNIEFEPRRRQDAESIIMVAEPMIARQFKPLFSFYYANDVPVFSPSIIYSGRPSPARDRDINGVYFTDLPWILDREPEFRQQAYESFDNLDGPLGRLFAMGADAWTLSINLPLMQQIADSRVTGHTGELWLDANNRVHRHQMWGVFDEGEPVIASEQDEDDSEPETGEETDSVIN